MSNTSNTSNAYWQLPAEIEPERAMRRVGPLFAEEYGVWDRNALCNDCFVDTTPLSSDGTRRAGPWEWYMVRDHVWREAGDVCGFLCIGCLEQRLQRELTQDDFDMDLPVNWPNGFMTLRLVLRICGDGWHR